MPNKYVKRILSARVYDVAIETPISPALFLSQRLGNTVLIKREDLQPVYSFKCRGAYNKIVNMSATEKQNGVICASAGNHAQGVALAGSRLGIKTVIVMPTTTPEIKVQSVRARGGRVVLFGDTFDEAFGHASQLMKKHGYTFVHPYDDPEVIAGQGTVAVEILRQHPGPLHAVFVPVGGGGLVAGMSAYIKYLRPDIKVFGVEPEDAACLKAALQKGRRVTLPEIGLFADGVAVAQIGQEPYRIARECVDGVITVTTDEICAAVKDLFEDTRSTAEPAGAVALAGLKNYVDQTGITGQTLLAVHSGANVNFDRLRHITERAEVGEQREALLAVTIPEQAGSFRAFCQALGRRNISEFNYRYADARDAKIFAGVQTRDGDRSELIEMLRTKGYGVVDMSDNELAKLHVRHMVGGHGPHVEDELLLRFEFPERPGALLKFLNHLGQHWNISLFHYRNHGAAYGRVLVGIQVPKADRKALRSHLDQLGYRFWNETDNPAYQAFLL